MGDLKNNVKKKTGCVFQQWGLLLIIKNLASLKLNLMSL